MRHDTFDYPFNLYTAGLGSYTSPKQTDDKSVKRLKLFWGFRYQTNSYKARKAGISRPSVMMKYKNDKFRLYGSPENNKLFEH